MGRGKKRRSTGQHRKKTPSRPHPVVRGAAESKSSGISDELKADLAQAKSLDDASLKAAIELGLGSVPEVVADTLADITTREALAAAMTAKQNFDAAAEALKARQVNLTARDAELSERAKKLEELEAAAAIKREDLDARSLELARVEEEVDRERERLQAERSELERAERHLTEQRKALNAREASILEREAVADSGFAEREEALLQDVTEKRVALQAQLKQLAEQRERFDKEWAAAQEQLRDELRVELAQAREVRLEALQRELDDVLQRRTDALSERETSLGQAEAKVAAELQTVRRHKQALSARTERHEDEVAELAEQRVVALQRQLEAEEARAEDLQEKVGELQAQQTAGQAVMDAFDGDPKAVHKELKQLRKERRQLKKALDERPDVATEAELQAKREMITALSDELDKIRGEHARLTAAHNTRELEVAKVEHLKREADALRAQNSALDQHLAKLKGIVDEARTAGEATQAFPGCAAIAKKGSKLVAAGRWPNGGLKQLAAHVRDAMASDDDPRYYDDRVVRSFVGGLAANRLLLLEGISGTGKTSLARAFSKAIGGEFSIVEVQAGWRDRTDLLGQFNPFDKRFAEREMLRALVKAGQPSYSSRPFFIILDEMNLSHPEHYFADFLSVLESGKPADEQVVELVGSELGNLPHGLVGGEKTAVRIPENVYFIGTANQDETTKGFADKTYDRAFVLELHKQPSFTPKRRKDPLQGIGFHDLHKAFSEAQEHHAAEANRAFGAMKDVFEEPLRELDVGWGARLDAQAKRYVPAVMACGGTALEAVDHLLASKLLLKLRGRIDVGEQGFELLSLGVESLVDKLGGDFAKTESALLLKAERKRIKRILGERE